MNGKLYFKIVGHIQNIRQPDIIKLNSNRFLKAFYGRIRTFWQIIRFVWWKWCLKSNHICFGIRIDQIYAHCGDFQPGEMIDFTTNSIKMSRKKCALLFGPLCFWKKKLLQLFISDKWMGTPTNDLLNGRSTQRTEWCLLCTNRNNGTNETRNIIKRIGLKWWSQLIKLHANS